MLRSKRASFPPVKEERVAASKILPQPKTENSPATGADSSTAVRDALYASKIVSYAQGMELLRSATTEYKWNLNFGDIATIWRGGCIIRAKFLNRSSKLTSAIPRSTISCSIRISRDIKKRSATGASRLSAAIKHGVAVPAFSASLAYFDSYRSARLPANLLQAQRDFFGAHTYERVDKPGVFHTEWIESDQKPDGKTDRAENARAASRWRVTECSGRPLGRSRARRQSLTASSLND